MPNEIAMQNILQEDIIEEYFGVISTPKDTHILGNLEVWIYNSDREEYPPHCHVKTSDGSLEFEVSILNWKPFRLKKPETKMIDGWDEIDSSIKNSFFEWLYAPSTEIASNYRNNKEAIWANWNTNNPNNRLEKWVEYDDIDSELKELLNPLINLKVLNKIVINKLMQIYFNDEDKRNEYHKLEPQTLIDKLNIDIVLGDNKEAVDIVKNAENNVYLWSIK